MNARLITITILLAIALPVGSSCKQVVLLVRSRPVNATAIRLIGELSSWTVTSKANLSVFINGTLRLTELVVESFSLTVGGLQPKTSHTIRVTTECPDSNQTVSSNLHVTATLENNQLPTPISFKDSSVQYNSITLFWIVNRQVVLEGVTHFAVERDGILAKVLPFNIFDDGGDVTQRRLDYQLENLLPRWNYTFTLVTSNYYGSTRGAPITLKTEGMDCIKVQCADPPKCEQDYVLQNSTSSADDCCVDYSCVCDESKCDSIPVCAGNEILIKGGSGGESCCLNYSCVHWKRCLQSDSSETDCQCPESMDQDELAECEHELKNLCGGIHCEQCDALKCVSCGNSTFLLNGTCVNECPVLGYEQVGLAIIGRRCQKQHDCVFRALNGVTFVFQHGESWCDGIQKTCTCENGEYNCIASFCEIVLFSTSTLTLTSVTSTSSTKSVTTISTKVTQPTNQPTKISDVDGGYSAWSDFGSCKATQGSAASQLCFQVRTRICNNPTPQGTGRTCLGPSTSSRACSCSVSSTRHEARTSITSSPSQESRPFDPTLSKTHTSSLRTSETTSMTSTTISITTTLRVEESSVEQATTLVSTSDVSTSTARDSASSSSSQKPVVILISIVVVVVLLLCFAGGVAFVAWRKHIQGTFDLVDASVSSHQDTNESEISEPENKASALLSPAARILHIEPRETLTQHTHHDSQSLSNVKNRNRINVRGKSEIEKDDLQTNQYLTVETGVPKSDIPLKTHENHYNRTEHVTHSPPETTISPRQAWVDGVVLEEASC
eukprot:m.132171 g.132171  ORF g.132171 m.132171 type:complete len:781 (-) comp14641_c0_seq4:137-2479(-)